MKPFGIYKLVSFYITNSDNHMKLKYFIYSLIFVLFKHPILAQSTLPVDIAKETQNRIDKGLHLGTIIGIIDKNGTRYYGFGRVSMANKTKPDENSIFEIGSITKTFTATLLADLEVKGAISIQKPINTYLPVFGRILSHKNQVITLENLSTHTSGLPREPTNMDANDDHRYRNYTPQDLNAFLTSYKLKSASQKYRYSNLGVLIIEHTLETHLKTTYEALMMKRVIQALGMKDSYFVVPRDKQKRVVKGYRNHQETAPLDLGQFNAMGGLRSTAKDLLKYLEAQIKPQASTIQQAIKATHQIRFSSKKRTMGLGWQIMKRKKSGKTIYYHKGGTNGFVSFAGFDLEAQAGVVVLVNGRQHFSDLGFRLLDPTYPLTKVK
ncbi:MAG TPA: hypothetical protein DCS93_02065 [Microscillaceae bacterium]|nr:hypothetical protein [Microscillaceae bacterium]